MTEIPETPPTPETPETPATNEAPAAAALPVAAKTRVPVSKIAYHGDVGDIIGLHLINLLLNICTIGIYSFWGKTRIRRYMTSHLTLGKDAFQYTGTGGELFFGWIKALVIFVPLVILMEIPGVNLIVAPFFFGVIATATYLAMRYRLSRTTWRGVRFALSGSALSYLWISMKRALVNFFTLGFKIPKSDIIKWTYLASHIQYGETKCTYQGDHKKIFRIHVITWLIIFILPISGVFVGGILKGQELIERAKEKSIERQHTETRTDPTDVAPQAGEEAKAPAPSSFMEGFKKGMEEAQKNQGRMPDGSGGPAEDPEMMAAIMGFIFLFYGLVIVAIIARLWYHVALWQEKFRGLRLGNLRFKLDITAPAMLKMYALNILIIIFTLGLGKPITTHLIIRFFTSRLKIAGEIDELIVAQNKTPIGTGMGDALAADVGFDLGM